MRALPIALGLAGLAGGFVTAPLSRSFPLLAATPLITSVVASFLGHVLERAGGRVVAIFLALVLPLLFGGMNGVLIACVLREPAALILAFPFGAFVGAFFVPGIVLLVTVRFSLRGGALEGSRGRLLLGTAAFAVVATVTVLQRLDWCRPSALDGVHPLATILAALVACCEGSAAVESSRAKLVTVRADDYRGRVPVRAHAVTLPRVRRLVRRRAIASILIAAATAFAPVFATPSSDGVEGPTAW
jgi:hypothetical protein